MALSPGDIVANKFGHVLAVSRLLTDGKVSCIYECNPSVQHLYSAEDLRLLSHSKGVDMSHWNSGEFADKIKRSMEWAKNVQGLPRKYKAVSKQKDMDLSSLSVEELQELLNQATGDNVPKEEKDGNDMGENVG
jgi:glycosyltransferase A (GT-A) superfamily protein (DUF2064 family)